MDETQHHDKKSKRALEDIPELAKDVVGFANASGGVLSIGIENDASAPPADQRISYADITGLRKRLGELTVQAIFDVNKETDANGGEYIRVTIPHGEAIASTVKGAYFIRSGDSTQPLHPSEILRLMTDRASFNWELACTVHAAEAYDHELFWRFTSRIRVSSQVNPFVKSKTDQELLSHYHFIREGKLTNLGVFCIGTREQRAMLGTAPIVQCIKYDEREQKLRKEVWDDFSLTPWELVDMIWRSVPEWQESYELPDGLFRKHIPVYDESVVRELIVNALVHRPYTQGGDIFINLYFDRLVVCNPGGLPLGVTPENILHTTKQRNQLLAKVFYDLKLMEREGSGFDRMYEVLLANGKRVPEVEASSEGVKVSIYRKIIDPKIIDFVAKADDSYQLSQKQRITLGILAQKKSLTVMQLVKELKLSRADELEHWVGGLVKCGLVSTTGRTRGKTFILHGEAFKTLSFRGNTTLGAVETPRLKALILQDLGIYKEASITEIQQRIGQEIPLYRIRKILGELTQQALIGQKGERRWKRYFNKNS